MVHVAQLVFDYGQLHNYSSFNYEVSLGKTKTYCDNIILSYVNIDLLTSVVHGSHKFGKEIETNLNLLRKSLLLVDQPTFHQDLSDYCYKIVYSKKYIYFFFI